MELKFGLETQEYFESEYHGSASEGEIISWVEERLEELAGYGSGSGPLYWRPEGIRDGTHIVEFSDSWGCGFIDEDTALLNSVNYVLMDEILGEYGVDVERWDMAYGDAGLVVRVLEGDGDSRLVSLGAVIVHEYLELLDRYSVIDDEQYSAAQFAMFMAIVMQETVGDEWTDELRGKLVQYMIDSGLGGTSIDESRYWVDRLVSAEIGGDDAEWREVELEPGCKQEWLDIPTGDVRDLISW